MFSWRNKTNINSFWLKKAAYLEVCSSLFNVTFAGISHFACSVSQVATRVSLANEMWPPDQWYHEGRDIYSIMIVDSKVLR